MGQVSRIQFVNRTQGDDDPRRVVTNTVASDFDIRRNSC